MSEYISRFTGEEIDELLEKAEETSLIVHETKLKTITLTTSGWIANGNTYKQTTTVSGIKADEKLQEIHITPASPNRTAYIAAGIYASKQEADKIIFIADSKPTTALTVYAVIRDL